jgi:hypothetical protein
MPDGMVPPGYKAVLVGQVSSITGLSAAASLEEGVAEGSLMLMRLDFADVPSAEALSELESKLREAGVPPWPSNTAIVYAEADQSYIYLAWQKGMSWMPIIIGILVTVLLPTLLGGIIWVLLPDWVKQLIEVGTVAGVMFLVMSLMKGLAPKEE